MTRLSGSKRGSQRMSRHSIDKAGPRGRTDRHVTAIAEWLLRGRGLRRLAWVFTTCLLPLILVACYQDTETPENAAVIDTTIAAPTLPPTGTQAPTNATGQQTDGGGGGGGGASPVAVSTAQATITAT